MKTDNFEDLMNRYKEIPIVLPDNLNTEIFEKIKEDNKTDIHMLPYLVASVIFINMFLSIITCSILYLMAPLTIIDWLIVGSIFSSFNGLFYGFTYAYREKVYELIIEIGGM